MRIANSKFEISLILLCYHSLMAPEKTDLTRLHKLLQSTIVEIEMAIDSETYPDWTETKENLLHAIEVVRKLERDQTWSKLSKPK